MVNKQGRKALTKVADWLEAGAPKVPEIGGFNMNQTWRLWTRDYSGKTCGSVGCIAGAICQFEGLESMNNKKYKGPLIFIKGIGDWCGMDEDEIDNLFWAHQLPNGNQLQDVTPDQAARTIRHYLNTGVIDWSPLIGLNQVDF